MKRQITLLIFTFLFLLSGLAYSQNVLIGVRGGLNLAKFVGQDVGDVGFKPHAHFGPYARVELAEKLYFQPEVLFSGKGYKNELIINNVPHTFKNTLYYIDIPLLLTFEPLWGHMLSIGLQPSILVDDKFKDKTPSVTIIVSDIDIYNTLDLGFVLGYTYEFASGLNFGSRFTYGLPYVINDDLEQDDNEVHNLVLQVSVGYTFGIH